MMRQRVFVKVYFMRIYYTLCNYLTLTVVRVMLVSIHGGTNWLNLYSDGDRPSVCDPIAWSDNL